MITRFRQLLNAEESPYLRHQRVYAALVLGACCLMGVSAASAAVSPEGDTESETNIYATTGPDHPATEEEWLERYRMIVDEIDSRLAEPNLSRMSRISLLSPRVGYSNALGRWNESFDSSMELARLHEDQPGRRLRWLHQAVIAKATQALQDSDEGAFEVSLRLLQSMQQEHDRTMYASLGTRSEAAIEIVRASHGIHTLYVTSNVRVPALAHMRKELLVRAREMYDQDVSQQTLARIGNSFSEARFNLAVGLAQAEAEDSAGAAISISNAINGSEEPGQLLFQYLGQGRSLAIENWSSLNHDISEHVAEETARFVFAAEAIGTQSMGERGRQWFAEADAALSSFDTLTRADEDSALGWMAQRARTLLRGQITATQSQPAGGAIIVSPPSTVPLQ